jgi:hypothetical protein
MVLGSATPLGLQRPNGVLFALKFILESRAKASKFVLGFKSFPI